MCSEREADPVALAYLQAGFHAFVLRYSVGPYIKWPNPLEDYEQAMELIRSKEEEWNLYPDKIAVIGFSAGGHLAASAATMAKNRPNAAILGYAVLKRETALECLKDAPDLVAEVDKLTCPCFMFAARTDNVVPIENSIHFMNALNEQGIMLESHIYSYGPHGFSVCNSSVMTPGMVCGCVSGWVADSVEWLGEVFGDFADCKLTDPKYGRSVNGNSETYFSIDCTIGYIMENEEARAVLEPIMSAAKNMSQRKEELASAEVIQNSMIMRMTLRDILQFSNMPEEVKEQLDGALRKIPNR